MMEKISAMTPVQQSVEAVVFDLDGTLVDSAADIAFSLNVFLAEIGRSPLPLATVKTMIGEGAQTLIERALAATGAVPPADEVQALTRRFLDLYEKATAKLTTAYPGVAAALRDLQASGLRLGLCTNKPERATLLLLDALELAPLFTVIVGGDTLEGVLKPDPRPLLHALAALGAPAERAVMVGDSLIDVASARAAGLRVLVRRGGYAHEPAEDLGADGIFDAFSDLPQAIRQLS
jgi:phosphoglycolate phosphatase